jgi:transposase
MDTVSTPIKIRLAIVKAFHEQERTYGEIADLLGVGRATVNRVLRRHREAGTVDPRPRSGGKMSAIHGPVADLLVSTITKKPDSTCEELAAELEARVSVSVSRSSILRALHRLGFSQKKSRSPRWSATIPSTAPTARRS